MENKLIILNSLTNELKTLLSDVVNSDNNFESLGGYHFLSDLDKWTATFRKNSKNKFTDFLNSKENRNYRNTIDNINLFAHFITTPRPVYNYPIEVEKKIKEFKAQYKDTKLYENPDVELTIKK
jgi:hypothetical protein